MMHLDGDPTYDDSDPPDPGEQPVPPMTGPNPTEPMGVGVKPRREPPAQDEDMVDPTRREPTDARDISRR